MTIEYQVALPSVSFPRDGCYKPGNDLVRLKFEVAGNCLVSVAEPGDTVTRGGGSALGVSVSSEIETALVNCEAGGGFELSMTDVASAFSDMDQRALAAACLRTVSAGLSRQFTLIGSDQDPLVRGNAGTQASFDSDLCFFAANIGLTLQRQIRVESSLVTASIAVSGQVRFGPGLRVYTYVGRRVGLPVIERFLMRFIPELASEAALVGLFRAAGIWAFAIEAGYDMMQLSQWICRTAYQRGVRRGQSQAYASAYIRTVYIGHYYRSAPNATERTAIEQAERDARHLGYVLLRQRLEERYNRGQHFRFNQYQQFLTTDRDLGPLINRFGEALDAGASRSLRH